jgi:hypothetical protein
MPSLSPSSVIVDVQQGSSIAPINFTQTVLDMLDVLRAGSPGVE